MKILFHVEPRIELGKPEWNLGWIHFAESFRDSLAKSTGTEVLEYALIVGSHLLSAADSNRFCVFSISQETLLKPFGGDGVKAAEAWYRQTYSEDQLAQVAEVYGEACGCYIPDLVISWTPAPYLKKLWPDCLILHCEYGMFSRTPYGETWYFDPCGMYARSYPAEVKIEACSANSDSLHSLEIFRRELAKKIDTICPFAGFMQRVRALYNRAILLPLQFSNFYAFDCIAPFKSQQEYLNYVLAKVPADIAVVVTVHPDFSCLDRQTLTALRLKHRNLIFSETFNEYYASSQYLVRYVDAVVTVSSGVGWQALLWRKHLVAIGDSQLTKFSDGDDLQNLHLILDKPYPAWKDSFLLWALTHYWVPAKYCLDGDWFSSFLVRCWTRRAEKESIDFYSPIAESQDVLKEIVLGFDTLAPRPLARVNTDQIHSEVGCDMIEFTGERYVPGVHGNIELEHMHRYRLASFLSQGKTVLDIASGEGYGAALLATNAKHVYGVDIDAEAVRHATKTYAADNLEFRVGECSAIPLGDACVDLVVSFETIEHHDRHDEMLREFKRVLKPDGVVLISSPDKRYYSDQPGQHNEFHVKELYADEFKVLLGRYFENQRYFGQKVVFGSLLADLSDESSLPSDNFTEASSGITVSQPVYLIAVASDGMLPLISADMYEASLRESDLVRHLENLVHTTNDRCTDLDAEMQKRGAWALGLQHELELAKAHSVEMEACVAEQRKYIAEQESRIAEQNNEIYRRGEWGLRLDCELKEAQLAYQRIVQSRSWRITKPLREIKQWIFHPVMQCKRYVKWMFRLLKRLYKKVFRKAETRYRHKRFLTRIAPCLLRLAAVPCPQTGAVQEIPKSLARLQQIDSATIRFDTVPTPLVSIIIPVYGQLSYTLRCLASIQQNKPRVPFEVIVVDDRSPDESVSVLEKIPGLRLLCKDENSGFIKTCNAGADIAKGEYLCFLNNDTEVMPGWLDELVRTFTVFPGTGLVGSKLIYPDGTLQEAGGIIWSDGSAWNFGRGQDPSLPVFNYAREVDYCSGASIMVPAKLFKQLGGFDTEYCPAYGEDSDLALKIRSQGFRVLYQPTSVVIHYEGKTSGTDTGSGVKAYQIENSKKLFERWKENLSSHQAPGVDVDAAKDHSPALRMLVLDHCTPQPDCDAGSVTVVNMLYIIREMGFQITFIPEDNFLYMDTYTPSLQSIGIEVLTAPYIQSVSEHLAEYGTRYDVVLVFRPNAMSRQYPVIKKYCPKAKLIYHTVDLHFLRMERDAAMSGDSSLRADATKMKKTEINNISVSDATIVHSSYEKELLSEYVPDIPIHVFPLILKTEQKVPEFDKRRDLVFIGGFCHTPNVDAVVYFVEHIMPLVRKKLPGVRFRVVGSFPPPEVKKLECEDVCIEGFVEDLDGLLDTCRLSVVPLRFGAGIKGKIGSAMSVGVPVVATSIAVEGMGLRDGVDICVADSPEDFTAAIESLYLHKSRWEQFSRQAISFSIDNWSAKAAQERLAGLLRDVGVSPVQASKDLMLYDGSNYFTT